MCSLGNTASTLTCLVIESDSMDVSELDLKAEDSATLQRLGVSDFLIQEYGLLLHDDPELDGQTVEHCLARIAKEIGITADELSVLLEVGWPTAL